MGRKEMARWAAAAICLAAISMTGSARAEEGKITGTWKWNTEIQGKQRANTLKLKLEGDKLTGAMVGRNNQETAIEDAKFKDGEVSFKVVRERGGMKFVTKYKGKLDGDKIKGKTESERNGEKQERDWEAKRESA
jgi:hypothetical protein